MTSVPATIDSFVRDLELYHDFSTIKYKLQKDFASVDKSFKGIVFCSVQYLKADKNGKKKKCLKSIHFDVMIIDESHKGSSTDKTRSEILDVDDEEENKVINAVRKDIKITIFASGTADKTTKYYHIPPSYVYEWETEDEACMKDLAITQDKKGIITYMESRHGPVFTTCLNDDTLNKDYSHCPVQVLMKHSLPQPLLDSMNLYNEKVDIKLGYTCSSLFALKPIIVNEGKIEYEEEFELENSNDGIELLKGLFDCIISNDMNERDTIMKHIEDVQSNRKSRMSTVGNPLLFIVYLPTHMGNNNISTLQKAIVKFLNEHNLWSEYNIEYSNAIEDSGNVKEEYNTYIRTIMDRTKKNKKRGCILLLGEKGNVGITYHDCDATISLDGGHNLDLQKQKCSRALTEAKGKTIGINVDMNIQRAYTLLMDVIQRHRKNTKTTETNAEITCYLHHHNIFLFDAHRLVNNGIRLSCKDIKSYYTTEVGKMMKEVDDTLLLESITCDNEMREYINSDFQRRTNESKEINDDVKGEQPDCPKGDKTKTQVELPNKKEEEKKENKVDEIPEELINQTYEMCKGFLFPLLSLISCSYGVFDFKKIFTDEKTSDLIERLLVDKKIDFKNNNKEMIISIMTTIIDKNEEIVDNIREIYRVASPTKLRELIAKHFIPSIEEKKNYAEFPTPVKELVDPMLAVPPIEFWTQVHAVLEPCCGKGNFVLGIFDKFYNGLETMFPDKKERCRVIITKCIHYADITALNVFITTEILKCHVANYCGERIDLVFNSHVGDTLVLDVKEKWGVDGFDAVIGNPPYNKGKNSNYYVKFINYANDVLNSDGYLLYVTPNRFLIPQHLANKSLQKLQVIFIYHTTNCFKVSTDIGYFLAMKSDDPDNTSIETVFNDGKKLHINLDIPTPTASNDIKYKMLSDKIMCDKDKLEFIKAKKETMNSDDCIFLPRHWTRFATSKKKGGKHVFNVLSTFGDDGRYVSVDQETKTNVIWYLTRSKIIRFITNNYASTVFIPPFIWINIPVIDFHTKYSDRDLYTLFNLTKDEIELIEKIVD
jgi:hypothetical protein